MPSARPSAFKGGGGGILRDQDGTIVGLEFSDVNPLSTKEVKDGAFHSLWALLNILPDGASRPTIQPIWVGDADAFGITEDKMGLTGDAPLSKSSSWFILVDSMVNPNGAPGTGFDEENFPDDPETADYGALVGARFRFNWKKDERATAKFGKKVSKKDPKKSYDRENLIATNYYGQVEVTDAMVHGTDDVAPAKTPAVKTKAKAAAFDADDVTELATAAILKAVREAKDGKMSQSKVSVKMLTSFGQETPELRQAVRAWVDNGDNLASIDGLTFDAKTKELSVVKVAA